MHRREIRRSSSVPPLLLGGIASILAAGAAMGLIEQFVFFPDSVLVGTPASVGLTYEDVEFPASDGVRLHGWFVPGPRNETLLWFHGNAGNVSHRLDQLRLLHDLVGAGVFAVDYRQYGRSAGKASEQGLYADGEGALSYLRGRPDVDARRIVYFGQSLGSAVAIDLAARRSPSGLVLETPFLSLRAMAGTILPGPLSALLPQGFDNLGKIERVGAAVLFIHGDRDEIVPYEQGRQLFAAAKPPKAFYTVRGAGHNDNYIVGGEAYFRRLREFIETLAERP
jgi:fermentation-respiration switch protein FrsA (DUF1100 family)